MKNEVRGEAERLAKARWEGRENEIKNPTGELPYVESVSHVESAETRRLLPDHDVFGIEVFNPRCRIAGRPFFHYSLVTGKKDGSAHYLENDEHVAKFLSGLRIKGMNEGDIKDLVVVFGLLRKYEIWEEPVGGLMFDYGYEKFGGEDWKLTISKTKKGWDVLITFLTDPIIRSFCRYHFQMQEDGKIRINLVKRASEKGYR